MAREIYSAPFALLDPSLRLSDISRVRRASIDMRTAHEPNDDSVEQLANRDFKACLQELRSFKPYKCVPPWGLPREVWLAALCDASVLNTRLGKAMLELFKLIRYKARAPTIWHASMVRPVDKHNHKDGCSAYRPVCFA